MYVFSHKTQSITRGNVPVLEVYWTPLTFAASYGRMSAKITRPETLSKDNKTPYHHLSGANNDDYLTLVLNHYHDQ